MRIRDISPKRCWYLPIACALVTAAFLVFPVVSPRSTAAFQDKQKGLITSYDSRVNSGKVLADYLLTRPAAREKARLTFISMQRSVDQLRAKIPGLQVRFSPLNLTVEMVDSKLGGLTSPAPNRSGFDIVRDFLRAAAPVYGIDVSEIDDLHFIGESVSPSGLRMVRFEQVVKGVPVFQSETRAIIDRDGRLIRTLGLLVPGIKSAEPLTNLLSPTEALASAMSRVGITLDVSAMSFANVNPEGTKAVVTANNPQISSEVASRVVYFPLGPGILIPAWSQITFTEGPNDWYTLVDGQTGALLWRKNIRDDASTQQARFSVYVQADGKTPADSPAPHSPTTNTAGLGTQYPEISRSIVNMLTAQDITASPNGWIDDGGTTTTGNNVDAYVDRAVPNNVPDAGTIDNNGRPVGNPDASVLNRDFLGTTPRDYTYNPAPVGGNPEAGDTPTGTGTTQINFRRGAVTQLFYITNWYHDQLYNLGFNEAAGNFQQTNFSGMGLGGDRVLAENQDLSGTNNANFSTPPDGSSGRMQMFRFTGPTIDRDGSLDAEIVMHELTHGVSNRLIGNAAGLNWDIGAGMGEGWSDFYALSLLNNTNADNPNGLYAAGAYATYKLSGLLDNYTYGIRRFPYTTDNSINPMTWADVDDVTNDLSGGISPSPLTFNNNGAMEVHNVGEIWCLTLWEVRSRIIQDPAGANGDVPTGNHTMLQLTTDALKMTPVSPSFTDARDAIIAADGATHSYANEESIWGGFADRGLGYNSYAPQTRMFGYLAGHVGIKESFSVPYLDKGTVTISDTPGGNNNGAVDPGEQISVNVPLFNPWHKASKGVASATATLTSSTPGVTIINGSSTYPAIAAQATMNGTPFTVRIASSVTCGQALDFTVTTTSSLGTTSFDFRLRVGAASGTGAPVTYTKTIASPFLAIPDGPRPRGVTDTMTVTDDFEIADLDFRVDDIHHTFTGDLTVMLKGPSGYGTDLVSVIGGLIDGGPGDNIINMVIDDEALATQDQLLITSAQAPYTGSWLPVFNAGGWVLAGFGPQDPVPNLSLFDGTSTKGTWTVLVSDQFAADTGTLRAWSIIVTPVAFTCTPFVCPNPTVTCPGNITKSNDPNQCGAVSTFTATASSDCSTPGAVSCTPASGSFFPKGTTTVTCTSTDDLGHTGSCTFTVTVVDSQPPTITCPANQTTSNDPNQCGAVVNYPAPTVSDNCPNVGAPTCSPASGSFFPVGTTTVTCMVSDASNNSASCTFTVRVNDTQPPSITCPGNVTAVTPTIGGSNAVVTFPPPTATDNCPGVTSSCNPPSGSSFPVGCTTVTCTATDTSSNTATCSFQVCVFDICLQDDSNANNRILINSQTGDYRFCCNGTTYTGRGKMTIQGSTFTLEHNTLDRRVRASVTASQKVGNASLQSPPGRLKCNITDSNTANNTNCTTCQ